MPLRRTPRTLRETAAARALRAAVAEAEAAMIARIPTGTRKQEKAARKGGDVFAKARAKWESASPAWREKQAAKDLAFLRRYDRGAALPADGGRDLYAARKLHVHPEAAAVVRPAAPVVHTAAPVERPTYVEEATSVPDERPEQRATRKRRPAGHVGYIDPRLFDTDDWEF